VFGRSRGVMNGGRLQQVFRRLNVVALPGDLPAEVAIDITPLHIRQSRRVRDIQLPGVKFLDPQDAVVVSVKMARGAVMDKGDDEEEEGAAE
jgi:large subunit ribosomal protein L25